MANASIGPRIQVEGEEKYRSQIAKIIAQAKALDSEMQAITASFGKNATAQEKAAATTEILTKRIETQKERLKLLEEMLARSIEKDNASTEATEEHSTATLKWMQVVNNAKAELNKLTVALAENTTAAEAEAEAEADIAENVDEVVDATEKSSSALNAKAVVIGNIITDLARKGASLIKEIGEIGLSYDREMERYTKAMTNSLGSAEAATKAIANIKKDALDAPLYSVDALTRANQMLISTGESAEDARATIMGLSEAISAAGGGNDELTRMASNLQQVKNAGKATAMDIRQFAYAGIDIYGVLADYTGKSAEDVQNLEVSYQLVSKALQAAAMEGGRYYGSNAAQAATLNGQLSAMSNIVKAKLGEAFQGTADLLRDELLPAASDFVKSIDTEKAVDFVEDFTTAAVAAGGALYAISKAKHIMALADEFASATKGLQTFTRAEQKAIVKNALLNESVGVSNVVAGVLTGKIELATAAQLAWNAASSLFPAALIVAGVSAVAVGIKKGIDATNEYVDALVNEGETIDDVRANLEKYRQQEAEMEAAAKSGWWTDIQQQNYDSLRIAIAQTEARLEEMTAAEREAAEAAAEHSAYLETTEGRCDQLTASLEELLIGYQETYTAAYESLTGQFGLFEQVGDMALLTTDEMLAAMQSQADYFNSYAANLDLLGSLTVGSMGLNAELVAQLNDGSDKSVLYAASLVQGYQEALAQGDDAVESYVKNVNTAFDNQQQAMAVAAESIAKSKTDIDTTLVDMVSSAKQAAIDMDQYEAMQMAAVDSIQGYIDGLAESDWAVQQTMATLGANAMASFTSQLGGPMVNTSGVGRMSGGARVNGSHATGLDYVPYDGYLAELHKGEMILNSAVAAEVRRGAVSNQYGNISVVINATENQSAEDLYNEFEYRLQQSVERRRAVFG